MRWMFPFKGRNPSWAKIEVLKKIKMIILKNAFNLVEVESAGIR
jgi:hypothetical protein